jgi:hypothetical protein
MVSGCSLFPGSSEIEREAKRAHLLRVRSEGAGDELRLTAHLQPVQHLYRVTITAPGLKSWYSADHAGHRGHYAERQPEGGQCPGTGVGHSRHRGSAPDGKRRAVHDILSAKRQSWHSEASAEFKGTPKDRVKQAGSDGQPRRSLRNSGPATGGAHEPFSPRSGFQDRFGHRSADRWLNVSITTSPNCAPYRLRLLRSLLSTALET